MTNIIKILCKIQNFWYNACALDGELAVPCDLQSATAGSNTHRGIEYGMSMLVWNVDIKVLCNLLV